MTRGDPEEAPVPRFQAELGLPPPQAEVPNAAAVRGVVCCCSPVPVAGPAVEPSASSLLLWQARQPPIPAPLAQLRRHKRAWLGAGGEFS